MRQVVRVLRRSPVSAGAAIVTLALTIGTGASIFAVVDAVLLTPPPFTDPGALVVLGETPAGETTVARRAVGYATLEAWRQRARGLASVEAFDAANLTLTGLGDAERVSVTDATPGLLPLLGVNAALGRLPGAGDLAQPVAVIGHEFWRGKLAADPAVIGRRLTLGGRVHTIIGVLPETFSFELNPSDVWRPLPLSTADAIRSGYRVRPVARLADGVSARALADALDDVSGRHVPAARAVATPIRAAIAGTAATTLGLLGVGAAIAMLVAVMNLAALLVVRSMERRRELAVMSALGARRGEIARQLLLEAAAIVAIGASGGVLLAFWMTPIAGRLAIEQLGVDGRDIGVSWRVIALVGTFSLVAAGVCGCLSAARIGRRPVGEVLRRGTTSSRHELALRRVLVAGELAVAFALLVSMALVGRTLVGLLRSNPGFDARGVLTLQVAVPPARYATDDRVAAFYSALETALEGRLGSGGVAIVDEIPATGDGGRVLVGVDGPETMREAVVRSASVNYFDVMRVPILDGRPFGRGDDAGAPARAIVGRSLAAALFGRERAAGRRARLGADGREVEIIGVSGDVKHGALDREFVPTVYLPSDQAPSTSAIVVIRTGRSERDTASVVRSEVAALDASVPVYNVRWMDAVLAASPGVPERRVLTAAFTAFAVLALVLATIGLFGLAAHEVASRRAELALRLALGADARRILTSTLARAAVVVGCGVGVGWLLSLWAARGLAGVIARTPQSDLVTVVLAMAVLALAAFGAVLPAALRASRTDPIMALRGD